MVQTERLNHTVGREDQQIRNMAVWKTAAYGLIFVLTGIMQPLLVQILTYNGACEKSTSLCVLPNYIGMSFSIFSRLNVLRAVKSINWRQVLVVSLIDSISQGFSVLGLEYAGSALYIVIYSGTTVWAAILSRIILSKRLSWTQWTGVLLLVVGLSITASDSKNTAQGSDQGFGILLVTFGSMLHALTWVLIEKASSPLGGGSDKIEPELLCTCMGLFGTSLYSAWQIAYTSRHYQELILDYIASHNGDLQTIYICYIYLIVVSFLHAIGFFYLVSHTDSTTSGVLKGLTTIGVFITSHFAFCSVQPSHALTKNQSDIYLCSSPRVVVYTSSSTLVYFI